MNCYVKEGFQTHGNSNGFFEECLIGMSGTGRWEWLGQYGNFDGKNKIIMLRN